MNCLGWFGGAGRLYTTLQTADKNRNPHLQATQQLYVSYR
jgi:hypothetical protein